MGECRAGSRRKIGKVDVAVKRGLGLVSWAVPHVNVLVEMVI
jgi:hypothetical protein